jgi:hypothetical protein
MNKKFRLGAIMIALVSAVIGIGVTPIPLQQQQSAHTWTDPSPQIRSEKAPIATD